MMEMAMDQSRPLAHWQKACLVLTIFGSIAELALIFMRPRDLPISLGEASAAIIVLAELWSPLVFYRLGLLATSSLSASVLSLMEFGAVILVIQDPSFPKLLSLVFLAVAVFYLLYSTRTWRIYEISWLDQKRMRTAAARGGDLRT